MIKRTPTPERQWLNGLKWSERHCRCHGEIQTLMDLHLIIDAAPDWLEGAYDYLNYYHNTLRSIQT